MRNLAVFGSAGAISEAGLAADAVEIDGAWVRSAIVETADPAFNPRDPAFARHVVVNVHAFSCNYRDKALVLRTQAFPPNQFFAIGSEFVGTVVEVGSEVRTLAPGDRVINQNHYTGRVYNEDGTIEGLPTNQASKEYQLFHESKLVRIPDRMPDSVAAGFSIGAQTAYSMVRRLAPEPGARVLIPSAASNTSLHVLAALRDREVRAFAATTSRGFEAPLMSLGAERVVHVAQGEDRDAAWAAVAALAAEIGGFDQVIDPYFDLHLESALPLLNPFGSYVTCGLLAQNPEVTRRAGITPMNAEGIVLQAMLKNLSILGNCIGLASDLEQALRDYDAGRLDCVVDSVHSGTATAPFLERTFNERARFGKVVFQYD